MSLVEGPEAEGMDPQVHRSHSIDPQRLLEVQLHLDRTRIVGDGRCVTSTFSLLRHTPHSSATTFNNQDLTREL
jgi:hypothetical protein